MSQAPTPLPFVSAGSPTAQPLVLLHGGGVAGWMWRPVLDRLAERFHVIVPDLPGHGAAAQPPYRSHAEALGRLRPLITAQASAPVVVVGFSLGAQLAVLLAAEHPELVSAVVPVSAQTLPLPAAGFTLGLLGLAAPLARQRWFARLQAKELFIPPALLEDYLAESAAISRETLLGAVGENLRFTVPAAWSGYPGAALILAGARERRLMRDSARQLHLALQGSELELVPGCGHGIPLQRPEWFADRLLDWVPEPHRA